MRLFFKQKYEKNYAKYNLFKIENPVFIPHFSSHGLLWGINDWHSEAGSNHPWRLGVLQTQVSCNHGMTLPIPDSEQTTFLSGFGLFDSHGFWVFWFSRVNNSSRFSNWILGVRHTAGWVELRRRGDRQTDVSCGGCPLQLSIQNNLCPHSLHIINGCCHIALVKTYWKKSPPKIPPPYKRGRHKKSVLIM